MKRSATSCLILLAMTATTAQAVTIETVPVGNLGNVADMRYNLSQRPEGSLAIGPLPGVARVAQFLQSIQRLGI